MSARRRSIEVEGLPHGANPIPNAARVGPLLVSGGIAGHDPVTGTLPEGLEAQLEHLFPNVERVLQAAGGSLDDVAKVTVFMRDREGRDLLNHAWLQAFPDEHSRPARHLLLHDLPGAMHVQVEVLAYLED